MVSGARAFNRLFPQKDVSIILKAVIQAGINLRKEKETEKENPLTVRLHVRLIRIYPFRDGPLSVQLQPEIPSSVVDADTLGGQIDLLVPSNLGYQVYFAIEAKRLRYHSPQGQFIPGNSKYVKNGMMRFITGQYAPFMRKGAMLGYVFDDDIMAARAGIDGHIQSKAHELKLKPPKRLMSSTVVPDNLVDETNHDLESRSFTIYHIFLSV